MLATSDVEALKAAMRAQARVQRRAVPIAERAHAAQALLQHDFKFLGSPGLLGVYHPVRSEIDCLSLARSLRGKGWSIALPVIVPDAPLAFHHWDLAAALQVGPYGIPEPAGTPLVSPTVLFVPLLAFDSAGHRLGYGGGNYDRTLADFRQRGPFTAIGLAFDCQEVPEIPASDHDQRLDWVLTPSRAVALTEGI